MADSKHFRILVLDSNRYHSLLVERELAERLPDTVVTVFHRTGPATEELAENSYEAVVIDDATAGGVSSELLARVRSCNPEIAVVVVSSVSLDRPEDLDNAAGVVWMAKDTTFHIRVADYLKDIARDLSPVADHGQVSRGDSLLSDAELINAAASTLAHEINNPLMTILGETELLLDKVNKKDSDLARKVRVIRRSAFRIKSSLSRLAGLSRGIVKQTDSGALVVGTEQPAQAKLLRPIHSIR